GGLGFFDPADDRFIEAGGLRAGAAEAVIDARNEEQAREFRRSFLAASALLDALVIINAARGGNEFVGQAVIDDEFAAVIAETRQVRIVGADDRAVLFNRFRPELFEARIGERAPVPLRVLGEVVEPILEGDAERLSFQR